MSTAPSPDAAPGEYHCSDGGCRRVWTHDGGPLRHTPVDDRHSTTTPRRWHPCPACLGTDPLIADFAHELLAHLNERDVPPTAVFDIARLDDHRFVLLEVNHVWASGLYGCDPGAVLTAIIAATEPPPDRNRWRWQPDPAVAALHRPPAPRTRG